MSENLFDTLLEPVFILNKELQIVYCNDTASQLSELSPRKIVRSKKKITDLLTFNESIEFIDHISQVKEPTPYKEICFSSVKLAEGKAQLTLQPFSEETWILFFRDVTLEERLQKKYRAELEQKEDVIADLEKARAQLEIYSKQLESLVEERTKEILSLNKTMKALLDSLNQGFFIFNAKGVCSNVFSKACLEILEINPSDQRIWDVLNLPKDKVQGFQNWITTLFSEMLPFEDLAPLGPNHRSHSKNRDIAIEYFPIRTAEGSIDSVACVATDITDLTAARQQAESDRAKVDSILKMIQYRKQTELFFSEAGKDIQNLNHFIIHREILKNSDFILRILHTLKGGAASFSYIDLKQACHDCESFFSENSFKIESESFDEFSNRVKLIGEIFHKIVQEYQLMFGKSSHTDHLEIATTDFINLLNEAHSQQLAKSLENKYFYEPIKEHISHYQDIISKTAIALNKKLAPLKVIGEELKIPKKRFDYLFQVLTHSLRNSIDHGIETTDVRIANQKSEEGHIEIHFSILEGVHCPELQIRISDDGQGINPQRIRAKLQKENSPLAQQPDEQIIYRIFDSNFSTKETISDISGRGVGMNAILAEVNSLGGKIAIETQTGLYTHFLITIPLKAPGTLIKAS